MSQSRQKDKQPEIFLFSWLWVFGRSMEDIQRTSGEAAYGFLPQIVEGERHK